MPSIKRAQESLDSDEDQSDSGLESAGSASPSHSRKRPRTSNTPPERNDESDPETSPHSSRSSSLAEDAMMNDEELELHQTQIIQQKYAKILNEENIPSEHGILERVDCYNFMCHNHFSVDLGPLINFIVGKNGSGKSAILTALTLCLGGKASATNRGQSLKTFIKAGKDNANIIVRIKNQGDGAYRPEVFGKSIIVERHFNRSGSSGFKIKAENGHIISTKKAELDSITDYFSLQIDNPMNVLSQDLARQFLSTSSATEKYKFFVKGVQLEQLDNDYRLIEESVDQMEEKIRSTSEDIKMLEDRRDAARKKLELSDQHDSLRERIRHLRNQMAWAQVEEQERTRDSLSDELAKWDEQIASANANLRSYDDRFQEVDAEHDNAADHALQADRAFQAARDQGENIEKRLADEMKDRSDLQIQQGVIRDYIQGAENRIAKAQKEIDAESQRLAEASNGGYARKQEECEQAAARATTARLELEAHVEAERGLLEERRLAENKHEVAKEAYEAKEKDHNEANDRLQNLRKENGQVRNRFHEKMPALIQAIRTESSWTTPPIGPAGDYVTLLKPKWSSILETALTNTLNSFIVSSKSDQKKLSEIMEKVKCQCPILIGSGADIDTSALEPDPQYDTALRSLEIEHPMVRRQLIINHAVEQMLLIESLEEASTVLFDGERPRNVKRCYCIDARDRRRGLHLSYNRSGDPNQAPVAMFSGSPRMKSDAALRIRAQEEVVQDIKRQLNDLKQDLDSASSYVQTCKQALDRHKTMKVELNLTMQRMEDEYEALKGALDQANIEEDGGRIDTLRTNLQDAKNDKQVNEGSFDDSKKAMEALMQNLKAIRRELSAQKTVINNLEKERNVAESERKRVMDRRTDILREKSTAIETIERFKEDRDKIYQKREELVERVLSYIEKASLVSTRVSVGEGETADSLDQKLHKLQNDLQRYHQHLGGSRDEIAAEAARAEAAYVHAMKQVEEHITLAEQLKSTLHHRKNRWELFRAHITSRAKAQFTYLLSERSFRGRLLTFHDKKSLDLQVEPDITKDDSTGRGAKTLSGGEKSFSQVCLLLALWEAMGSPIRCLDEFDVYMDHVNRKMSIDMLMMAARRSVGRQFILITPGSKTDITIAPDVRVKELAEPERGQTTLSF
ncbi:hypothetical protein N7520_002579 [Penicillium odoratum]|uniref:uncharacterized protein n=1 Tax=Penicillium odoratum TaxID=1167516 RepID=UPI002546C8EC|nr:uncharacterized protein N7520_002579 [Penicillium odoratum]KAJ5772050.1 hypothetical protein N7520_002579 [Penicillium odoratum]